jgi:predicted transcriptional regulator
MTKKELGERVRIIREDILKIKQGELAIELGMQQSLISRMEKGETSLDQILTLLEYYEKKGIKSHMLLRPVFEKNLLLEEDIPFNADQMLSIIEEVKEANNAGFTRLSLLIKAMDNK